MSDFEFIITDNTDLVKKAAEEAIEAALEAVGQFVEGQAKINLEASPRRVVTGNLRNSMTHTVKMNEKAVYVGTNVEYAPHVEYGTGIYGDKPTGSGAKTWWVYVSGSRQASDQAKGKRYTEAEARRVVAMLRAKGLDAHMTQGMKPNHFLKNAVQDNLDKIKQYIEDELKGD